jgi:protein-tyrosine phosphatase
MDDGAKHMTESIEMARLAAENGIEIIVATPKILLVTGTSEDIIERVHDLNDRLKKESILLTVLPGQECSISEDFIESYENGQLLSINNANKFIFLSLESGQIPNYTEKLIYEIQMKGLTPIIAHPEKNIELMDTPELMYQLVKKGACVQLSAGSIVGSFGKKARKFSLDLIEANLAHFIASDAQDKKSSAFPLKEAYAIIEKKFGTDIKENFIENAELVIEGKSIIKEVPIRMKKKKLFGMFK